MHFTYVLHLLSWDLPTRLDRSLSTLRDHVSNSFSKAFAVDTVDWLVPCLARLFLQECCLRKAVTPSTIVISRESSNRGPSFVFHLPTSSHDVLQWKLKAICWPTTWKLDFNSLRLWLKMPEVSRHLVTTSPSLLQFDLCSLCGSDAVHQF